MGDTAINVPVKVRTHELNQLHEFVPDVRDGLRQAELDEAADEVARIYDEHISGVEREFTGDDQAFAAYVSMPANDWKTIVRFIGRLEHTSEGTRAWWLQKKLVERLRERLEEMEDDE
jgi:hypothetical protein